MKKVVVTGASGFIGSSLMRELGENKEIVATGLTTSREAPNGCHKIEKGFWDEDIVNILYGCDTLVHLAGRAHVLNETYDNPMEEFNRVNVDASLRLVKFAAKASVKRLIFISSAHVMGQRSLESSPFNGSSKPCPSEPYAISKYVAENEIRNFCKTNSIECVIIRPPLVYGATAPANINRFLKIAFSGVPLPFGSFTKKKSLISINNLNSFIINCILIDGIDGENFLISDNDDASTLDILNVVKTVAKPNLIIFKVPYRFLQKLFRILKRERTIEKLYYPLQVDCSEAMIKTGWSPVESFDVAFSEYVKWFDSNSRN